VYRIGQVKAHLAFFLDQFVWQSQIKRRAVANTPKLDSGGSPWPRGDYRAPSDGEAVTWFGLLGLVPDRE
jgi:NAD+ synthase (glutamine-hydrolysing)